MMNVQDQTGSVPGKGGLREVSFSKQRMVGNLTIAWFALDAFLCLFPPLYWWADGRTEPILGVPVALLYFLAVSACTVASIVFAYFAGRAGDEVAA